MPGTARRLAAIVAPPRCGCCSAPCDSPAALCGRCREGLREALPLLEPGRGGLDLAVAAAPFSGVARRLVHGLKYARRLPLAEAAAEAILEACPEGELRGTVVPVPASPLRWRWRGFDPAEEIALALARRAVLPHRGCLRRSHGPRQVGRIRAARLADPPRVRVRGAPPDRVLLVDDVRTTGATLAACARSLRAAGTEEVVALTLAHVRPAACRSALLGVESGVQPTQGGRG